MKRVWMPLLMFSLLASAATAQTKPNVVLMLGDNVGYGDVGAYGDGEVRGMPTPRIGSIASQGLRLTQYLVEPACTPSRAALMTGRYSQRLEELNIVATNAWVVGPYLRLIGEYYRTLEKYPNPKPVKLTEFGK